MDLQLQGKAALVTGGSRGIGLAITEALAAEGARVAICARDEEGLARARERLAARAADVFAIPADVATEAGGEAAVAGTVRELGRIDVLINNAGGGLGAGSFERADARAWRAVVELNLLSAVWCSRPAVSFMREHGGGSIVHVSSLCGREYCASGAYSAAKAGLIALAKEMAIDLAKERIRVNSVAPGSIRFPGGSWDERAKRDPAKIAAMVDRELPWGRFGTPEEVAAVVAFLCSPAAGWITGACVAIDGGQGRAL